MSASWRRNRFIRGLVGILAGQILVLQVLLAGIVATEMALGASPDALAICHGNDRTAPAEPGKGGSNYRHATCVICAFASLGPPVPTGPALVAVVPGPAAVHAILASLPIPTSDRHSPRTSQGPPKSA
jgi:DUF2946 family protein